MTEDDILHERNGYWVKNDRRSGKQIFTVMRSGLTHSVSDSSYDDLSLAIARCDYLATKPRGVKYE